MNTRAKFLWSLRRELWEHRGIWIAPLAVSALVLAGFIFNIRIWLASIQSLPRIPMEKQFSVVALPYSMAASVILLCGFLAGAFYSLDALNAERRDRTVLFWKSMPISDAITVLAKVFVPLAFAPAVALAVALATQLVMLAVTSAILVAVGGDAGTQLDLLPLGPMTVVMLYGVAVHVLWFAPIFGYLLLVSILSSRAPLLWAVVPLVAVTLVERLSLGTWAFASLLRYRVLGAMSEAFTAGAMRGPITQLSQLDPVKYLSSPNLWLGLAFAVACIAVAIRLRRYREPA